MRPHDHLAGDRALERILAPAAARRPAVPRLALSKLEASQAIGCSIDYLEEHVLRDLARGPPRPARPNPVP